MIVVAMHKSQEIAPHGSRLKLHRGSRFGEVSNGPANSKYPANPPFAQSGTALALEYLTIGGGAFFASDQRDSRAPSRHGSDADRKRAPKSAVAGGRQSGSVPKRGGGARNRADRESHALTVAQVGNLMDAERHAANIGLPFNRMITIHWQAAGVPLEDMARATGHFADLLGKLLARHGADASWIWVHENAPGREKGGHCHLLAHVPPDLVSDLTRLQRGWLQRITGQPYRKGVIRSRPVGGTLGLEMSNPDHHAVNLRSALNYVLKGANPEAASRFGLERLKEGGRVIGKRCGTSQNIGPKARNLNMQGA